MQLSKILLTWAALLLMVALGPVPAAHARMERPSLEQAAPPKGLRKLRANLVARGRRGWQKLKCSRVGKCVAKARRKLITVQKQVRCRMTLATDRLEARLPAGLARPLAGIRRYNPFAFMSYAPIKFKKDPRFLGTYGACSLAFSYAQVPAMAAMGFGPSAIVVARTLLGLPVDLTVIALREHYQRSDRSQTFRGTLKHLAHEYRDHVATRRQQNYEFAAKHGIGKRSTLRSLASGLDPPSASAINPR